MLRALSRAWAPISILFFVFAWSNQTFQLIIGEPETVPLLIGVWVILTTIIVVYGVLNFFIERNFTRSRRIVAQAALIGTETAVPVATLIPPGVCQTSCPPFSCSVSDFRVASFVFWIEPDGSIGLPVAGFA